MLDTWAILRKYFYMYFVLALAIPSLTPFVGCVRFMYAGAGTFEEPSQGRCDEMTVNCDTGRVCI